MPRGQNTVDTSTKIKQMYLQSTIMCLEIEMPTVTDAKIREVARKLRRELYQEPFRGKERGRFCLTREQLRIALDTERLHPPTIERLQDEAMTYGLIIIDLDDAFPCIEARVARKYRRPPADVFKKFFPEPSNDEGDGEDDDE